MIKVENVDVLGWEAAIRGMYDGKGVRQVYNHSFRTGLQKKIHNQYGEFEVKKYGN